MTLCGKPAVTIIHWPTGQQLPCCDAHYRWAVKIANALGMALSVTDLDDENQTCTQHLSDDKAIAQERTAEAGAS